MTDREKLIELIEAAHNAIPREYIDDETKTIRDCFAAEADHLLANGVIVLPCKVGQTLYFLYNSPYANKPDLTPRIYETDKWYFDIDEKGVSILTRECRGYFGKYHYILGKTVFLAREEAEAALKEGQG